MSDKPKVVCIVASEPANQGDPSCGCTNSYDSAGNHYFYECAAHKLIRLLEAEVAMMEEEVGS